MFALISNLPSLIEYYLVAFVTYHALWACIILSALIFLQLAFVPAAFLPGDTLIIAGGVLAARLPENLYIHFLFLILFFSALIATNINYFIGEWLGPKIFTAKDSLFFKPKYLIKTDKLYKDWGGNIILFGSFIPIIRTFVPFMAGVSSMHFWRFAIYNLIGFSFWIALLLYGSYFFGTVPFVKEHFTLILFLIVIASILLPIVELIREKLF